MIRSNDMHNDVLAVCVDRHVYRIGDLTLFESGDRPPIGAKDSPPMGDCPMCGTLSFVWKSAGEYQKWVELWFDDRETGRDRVVYCDSCERTIPDHLQVKFPDMPDVYGICLGRLERSEP